jgi:GNAT superfamily N-acetyltransferase
VGALNFDVLGPDGGSVGSAKMSAAQGQVETPEIGWVGIDEAHQRKGLASWLYDEIERDIGQKLWPSPELISPEIQAFWQKRDPDRLARMLAGTYANAPTGSSVPLAMNALERAQPQGDQSLSWFTP